MDTWRFTTVPGAALPRMLRITPTAMRRACRAYGRDRGTLAGLTLTGNGLVATCIGEDSGGSVWRIGPDVPPPARPARRSRKPLA